VAVIGVPGAGAAEVAAAVAHATLARLVAAPPEYAVVGGSAAGLDAAAGDLDWRHAVEACAQPLQAKRWSPDPHGTVTDYWLHTVRLAAVDTLAAESLGGFENHFARMAAQTVPPHVAILLVAAPELLEAKIAARGRQSAEPAGAGVGAGWRSGRAVCAATDEAVVRLLRLQERIASEIRSPETSAAGGPRAVVTIAAGDFDQAVQEAVAVVEAMA
jgi:hypothetical protein